MEPVQLAVRDGARIKPVAAVFIMSNDPSLQSEVVAELAQHGACVPGRGLLIAEYHRNWVSRGHAIATLVLADAARATDFTRFVTYLRHGLDGTSPPKSAILDTALPSGQRYELAAIADAGVEASIALFAIGRAAPPAAAPSAGVVFGSHVPPWLEQAPPLVPAPPPRRPVTPPLPARPRTPPLPAAAAIVPTAAPVQQSLVPTVSAGVKRPRDESLAASHPVGGSAPVTIHRPVTPPQLPLSAHRPVTPPLPSAAEKRPRLDETAAGSAAAAAVDVSGPTANGSDVVDAFVAPHGHEYVHATEIMKHESSNSLAPIIARIVRMIVSAEVPFPYRRFCIRPAAIMAGFEALQHSDPLRNLRFEPYKLHGYIDAGRHARVMCDGPLNADGTTATSEVSEVLMAPAQLQQVMRMHAMLLPYDAEMNEMCCNLVDYFTEDARMDAVRKGEPAAPTAMWRRPEVAKTIVEKAIRKYHEVTDLSLRQGMYGRVGTCNLFKPNLARSLYTLLGGTRILDMCAGWGCRLIGALACKGVQRYIACDPNRALVAGHTRIISTFGAASAAKCTVICSPFETADLPAPDVEAGFDLALTSPPYFDLEVYEDAQQSHKDGQSIALHPTLQSWLQAWYFPMMLRAWNMLAPGGHLAIYINDHAREGEDTLEICFPMLQYASTLPACRWVGIIGIEGETQLVRPLWVWRKDAIASLPPLLYTRLREHAAVLADAVAVASGAAAGARYAAREELSSLSIGVQPPSVQAAITSGASASSAPPKRAVGLGMLMPRSVM